MKELESQTVALGMEHIVNPIKFYKCLADETRLSCLLLISHEHELCVCELTEALELSQPKVSRHLSQLRTEGVVSDRRQGQWVFYRINPDLDDWAQAVIVQTLQNNQSLVKPALARLSAIGSPVERVNTCC